MGGAPGGTGEIEGAGRQRDPLGNISTKIRQKENPQGEPAEHLRVSLPESLQRPLGAPYSHLQYISVQPHVQKEKAL
jgi:hypothetical protein